MEAIDLFSAILYLLPGFLFIEIFRKYYPTKKDSDFARILHSVLWSLPLFSISYFVDKHFPIPIEDITLSGKSLDTSLIIFLYSISIFLAYSRVLIRNFRFMARKSGILKLIIPKAQSLWLQLNREQDWAVIITKDGCRYLGYISEYTYDIDSPNEIDLLLAEAACVDEHLNEKYKINGKGIYLKLSEISRIEFYR